MSDYIYIQEARMRRVPRVAGVKYASVMQHNDTEASVTFLRDDDSLVTIKGTPEQVAAHLDSMGWA